MDKALHTTLCFFAFFCSFTLYLITVAPDVTGEDSGEFIAACHSIGIAHPQGYPLFTLCGKFFAALLPFGNIAFRVNLCSSFFGALTVCCFYLFLVQLTKHHMVAFSASMLLATSKIYWSQAVITEVYSLHAFFFVILLFCLYRWWQTDDPRFLYLLGFLTGLSLANHYITFLLLPMVVLIILGKKPGILFERTTISFLLLVFLVAISTYFVLPIRAINNPGMNWGDPKDFYSFVYQVQRLQYKNLEFGESVTITDKLFFIAHFGKELITQFTVFLFPLAIIGIFSLYRHRFSWFVLSLALFLMTSLFLILLLHFAYNRENVLRVTVYYIPAYIVVSFWVAEGMIFLEKILKRRRILFPFAKATTALWLIPCSSFFPLNDYSYYYLAHDYVVNLFQTMEQGAIVFPSGDYQTFPLLYSQVVEKARPDILIGDKYGKLEKAIVDAFFALPPTSHNSFSPDEIQAQLIKSGRVPIYYATKQDLIGGQKISMRPCGILYKADSGSCKQDKIWNLYRSRMLDKPREQIDSMGIAIISSYPLFRGLAFLENGDVHHALEKFNEVLNISPDVMELMNNIGGALASKREFSYAKPFFDQALHIDPYYWQANVNMAVLSYQLSQNKEAVEHYQRAFYKGRWQSIDFFTVKASDIPLERPVPPQALSMNNNGVIAAKHGDLEKAKKLLQNALETSPYFTKPRENLALLACREHDYRGAFVIYQELVPLLKPRGD